MIAEQDRSGWFGASDTAIIMGSWQTRSFESWWRIKLGLETKHLHSDAIQAGTCYEHAILDAIGAAERDRQIIIPELRLRVNLDGNTGGRIHEVKTHKRAMRRPPKGYVQQVQAQMFAAKYDGWQDVSGEIVAYRMTEEEYRNFFLPIDPDRLRRFEIPYDIGFVAAWLRRLMYLAKCLEEREWPYEIAA